MSIQVQPSHADHIRALAAQHPYMTPHDIAALSGVPLKLVKAALARKPKRRIKLTAK
jgi:hypothetical protein